MFSPGTKERKWWPKGGYLILLREGCPRNFRNWRQFDGIWWVVMQFSDDTKFLLHCQRAPRTKIVKPGWYAVIRFKWALHNFTSVTDNVKFALLLYSNQDLLPGHHGLWKWTWMKFWCVKRVYTPAVSVTSINKWTVARTCTYMGLMLNWLQHCKFCFEEKCCKQRSLFCCQPWCSLICCPFFSPLVLHPHH